MQRGLLIVRYCIARYQRDDREGCVLMLRLLSHLMLLNDIAGMYMHVPNVVATS